MKKIRIITLSALLVLVAILLVQLFGFLWLDNACFKDKTAPGKDANTPYYLSDIWPPPGSELWAGCYTVSLTANALWLDLRGINIKIDTNQVAEIFIRKTKSLDPRTKPIPDWVSLYIDGKGTPDSLKDYGCIMCPVYGITINGKPYSMNLGSVGVESFGWAAPLASGEHIAKIVIVIPGVETLQYTWRFTLK